MVLGHKLMTFRSVTQYLTHLHFNYLKSVFNWVVQYNYTEIKHNITEYGCNSTLTKPKASNMNINMDLKKNKKQSFTKTKRHQASISVESNFYFGGSSHHSVLHAVPFSIWLDIWTYTIKLH